jgi:endonuclease/exonuclease/phosphatase family metal-dependent hydrolase
MLRHRIPTSWRPAALLRALILSTVAWAVIGVGSAYADGSVTVMTQNVYQGTEFAHFAALQGTNPSFTEALFATSADYATYEATRFKDRSKQIAAAIAQNNPALVGLQEIATWHKGQFNPAHPFALPGPVTEDFTQELLAALTAEGKHYAVASRRDNNFTLAFPIFTPTFTCCIAVGMVESGVILARTDLPPGQLTLSNPQSGTYNARIPTIPNPLVPSEPFVFTNSWQSIDVTVPGKAFRFITTHLDALDTSGFVRGIQAKELLAGPANTSLPVVVTGDMNSGPKTEPPPYGPAAYNAFLEGGLSDAWTAAGLGPLPLTCCHLAFEDRVNDPNAEFQAGQEIDHVFIRGSLKAKSGKLVGNTVPNPAPNPFIWPSDHAGMVATLATGS